MQEVVKNVKPRDSHSHRVFAARPLPASQVKANSGSPVPAAWWGLEPGVWW